MASTQRQTNVEIVQRIYTAFNDGDLDTVVGTLADDVEWTEPAGFFIGGTFNGPDAVRTEVMEPCAEKFETFTVDPERFLEDGNTVVILGAFHATTPDGEHIESPFAHVSEVADGEIVRFENFTDTALWP
ncbi:nuclear transport factor 2 family protein [Haloarchaeobius sp. TZWSO28]|uniref:nuclear transport factor 2 family protein n=1 Tax=Haloarchaeobius sp. TZWSO28 TaxID=3446119 RepID=UPI003EBF5904